MTNEIQISIGGRSRTVIVPRHWDDLDLKKLMLFYEALFNHPGDEYSGAAFTQLKLIGILQMILQADPVFMIKWEQDRVERWGEHGHQMFLDELQQTMRYALTGGEDGDGLFRIETDEDTGDVRYMANLNRLRNPWPELVGPGRTKKEKNVTYYAPDNELANITIYEMGMAFSIFESYVNTGDIEHAERLIATIYRPSRPETKKEVESGWGGDRRQPIRHYESMVEARMGLVKSLPIVVKRIILFWFASCRQEIVSQYPKVFKKGGGEGKGSEYGWGGVLLSVAEAGPMGALGEVADQHYTNVLTYLSMKADEAAEREKALSSRKK